MREADRQRKGGTKGGSAEDDEMREVSRHTKGKLQIVDRRRVGRQTMKGERQADERRVSCR
jgi:hypothetical protein